MEKIVIVGSANTDLIVRADRIPSPGETVLGGEFRIVSGGKGANQAVAVARLGGDALFVARIGTDLFGDELMARYTAEKMDTSHVVRDSQAPTGVALITVDNSAENCIVVAPGANARLSRKDIDDVRPELAKAGYLLIQLEIPLETVEYAIQTAAELGVRVILNPAPAAQIDEKYLKYVYLLTPNESECALLTGRPVLNGTDAASAAETRRKSAACWRRRFVCSALRGLRKSIPRSSPAASSSAWRSRVFCALSRRRFCSTSRSPRWTAT